MPAPVPLVVVIDDDPESLRSTFRNDPSRAVKFEVLHPDEVVRDNLEEADLVLVDYVLSSWASRDAVGEISLQPTNGVALGAILREHCRETKRPTGFAIHTAEPEKLWITPAEPRAHVIARAYNLEWVFLKTDPLQVLHQSAELARAVQRLPVNWPGAEHEATATQVLELLGFDPAAVSHSWEIIAYRDVETCRPPITELAERNHGLLFLRWLLQRILPYPCFLIDSYRLAARLRTTHLSLNAALSQGLASIFAPAAYTGVLADFAGPRWWRAGVEYRLWELSDKTTLPASEMRRRVEATAGVTLEPTASDEPVVCIDDNYRVLDVAVLPSAVVRVQPDDWPPFASQAWTTIDLARSKPRLKAVVVEEDRGLLEQDD